MWKIELWQIKIIVIKGLEQGKVVTTDQMPKALKEEGVEAIRSRSFISTNAEYSLFDFFFYEGLFKARQELDSR